MGPKVELKKEDLLQAVVISDNFNQSFQPITSTLPSCLLPLAGRPLLEYTLQCLSYSGVQDVILYLTSNSSQVKRWLATSEWGAEASASPFSVTCITNEDCRSYGDAMRDLYEKSVLRNDFILVSGDLISNLDLSSLFGKHKDTFKKDKKAIMTALYSKGIRGHPLRSRGSELILATDKSNSQILFYQRSKTKSANFPIELFQHDEVEVIHDTLDPNIYICSPEVLALFSDNFDIQDMDTMIGEILESELVDSSIYAHVIQSGFCCRSDTPYLYGKVCQKVLNRWVYPMVPECKNLNSAGKICLQTNSVYRALSANIKKGTSLGQETYIGNQVEIDKGCNVVGSCLEQGVRVGCNSSISGSIVMRNTSIGDNCTLVNSIVGGNVTIPANCAIKDKVILGPGVQLKEGAQLPAGIRLASEKSSDGFSDDEDEKGDSEEGEFGPLAFVYEPEDDEDEDEEDEDNLDIQVAKDLWGEVYCTSDESDEESEVGSEDWELSGEEEEVDDGEHNDVKNFKREVKESLVRAAEEGNIVTDNLVLEINSSKHAWNTTLCEVNQCVLESVIHLDLDLDLAPPKLLAAVKANVVKFKDLLLKYSKSKSGEDYYLSAVVELVARFPPLMDIMAKVLHFLYEFDILGESSILTWAKKLQDLTLKKKIAPFLEWLEEEEDDDDESSEEESD